MSKRNRDQNQSRKSSNVGVSKMDLDVGASTTNIRNSILIMENLNLGGCETLETINMFLNPSIWVLLVF